MTMSERPTGGAGESPNKQKIIAVVVVIVFVVIVWQVIGMFRGGSTATAPAASAAITPAKPVATAAATTTTMAPTANAPQSNTQSQAEINVVPVPKEAELYKLQQEAQQKYITSLNELQTLRIQKEIAETNQAIAAAKLATVSAEKNIAELLTKPSVPTLPPSAYSAAGGAPQFSSSPPVAAAQGGEAALPVANNDSEAQYVLISVSMQLNKWNAVIGYRGKPYQVVKGTILPPDGSEVVSIDSSSVVLEKGGHKRKITLVPPA